MTEDWVLSQWGGYTLDSFYRDMGRYPEEMGSAIAALGGRMRAQAAAQGGPVSLSDNPTKAEEQRYVEAKRRQIKAAQAADEAAIRKRIGAMKG